MEQMILILTLIGHLEAGVAIDHITVENKELCKTVGDQWINKLEDKNKKYSFYTCVKK